jgi:hypothetical protein
MYVELPKGEARTAVRTSVRMFTSELQPDACWNGSFHPYQTIQDGLKDWYGKPILDKTWTNFQTHFEDEYDKLRLVRGTTMQQAGFHQANFVASQVLEEVNRVQENVLQRLDDFNQNKENIPDTHPEEKANMTKTDDKPYDVQFEMMKMLQSLQQEMKTLKQSKQHNNPNPNYKGNNFDPNYKANNRNQQPRQRDCYCWSHGCCGHKGKDCKNTKEGHKPEATFANKMGGSTYRCQTD